MEVETGYVETAMLMVALNASSWWSSGRMLDTARVLAYLKVSMPLVLSWTGRTTWTTLNLWCYSGPVGPSGPAAQ